MNKLLIILLLLAIMPAIAKENGAGDIPPKPKFIPVIPSSIQQTDPDEYCGPWDWHWDGSKWKYCRWCYVPGLSMGHWDCIGDNS